MKGEFQNTRTLLFTSKKDSIHSKTCSLPNLIITPLLWDMENIYGATKEPHWYLGAVGNIELDDFIQKIGI